MADPATEKYAKDVKRITEHWQKEIAKHKKQIDKAEKELAKLGVKPPYDLKALSKDKDKKKKALADCILKARAAIEKATKSLEINLKLIKRCRRSPSRIC